MDVQEALDRAESWRNNPSIRPVPNISREIAITLVDEIKRLSKDVARYQYLRSQPESYEPNRVDVVLWSAGDETCNNGDGIRGDALDAEIDRRMAASAA